MAIQLEGDDWAKVEAGRVSPRPQYFNAQTALQTTIGEDFEAFLILQDPNTISQTLQWLTMTGTLAESSRDRDSLLFEALIAEQQDLSDRQSDIDSVTALFNAWKLLFQPGDYAGVNEVGLIIKDLQLLADEIFSEEDRLNHLERVHLRIIDKLRQGITDLQLQEIQSWPTPLLAY